MTQNNTPIAPKKSGPKLLRWKNKSFAARVGYILLILAAVGLVLCGFISFAVLLISMLGLLLGPLTAFHFLPHPSNATPLGIGLWIFIFVAGGLLVTLVILFNYQKDSRWGIASLAIAILVVSVSLPYLFLPLVASISPTLSPELATSLVDSKVVWDVFYNKFWWNLNPTFLIAEEVKGSAISYVAVEGVCTGFIGSLWFALEGSGKDKKRIYSIISLVILAIILIVTVLVGFAALIKVYFLSPFYFVIVVLCIVIACVAHYYKSKLS